MEVDLRDTDGAVHVVNPGDDRHRAVPPPRQRPVADGDRGAARSRRWSGRSSTARARTFEIYVPEWFADIFAGKFPDADAFLDGTIAYVRTQESP